MNRQYVVQPFTLQLRGVVTGAALHCSLSRLHLDFLPSGVGD